mmetsp:Transcript_35567/g.93354  ORF Transcript_35567/g.93354 Transcript_35567/m.93354 type:complete len:252 (-) Transcript_35567:718-1473(-)
MFASLHHLADSFLSLLSVKLKADLFQHGFECAIRIIGEVGEVIDDSFCLRSLFEIEARLTLSVQHLYGSAGTREGGPSMVRAHLLVAIREEVVQVVDVRFCTRISRAYRGDERGIRTPRLDVRSDSDEVPLDEAARSRTTLLVVDGLLHNCEQVVCEVVPKGRVEPLVRLGPLHAIEFVTALGHELGELVEGAKDGLCGVGFQEVYLVACCKLARDARLVVHARQNRAVHLHGVFAELAKELVPQDDQRKC